MAMHEVYFIRSEVVGTGVSNYELVRLDINTLLYNAYLLDTTLGTGENTKRIKTGRFKCLQDDIQGNWLLFACELDDGTGLSRTFLYDISANTCKELVQLSKYALLTLDVACVYDINSLVFLYIKNTNTLVTMTIMGEAYVDEQKRIIAERAGWALDSIFQTSYNGLLYLTEFRSAAPVNRGVYTYHVNSMDKQVKQEGYTDPRKIKFIDEHSNTVYIDSNDQVIYDYSATKYYAQAYANNPDVYAMVMIEPINQGASPLVVYERQVNADFKVGPVFKYAYYDIDNKLIMFNTAQLDTYFQFSGIIVDLDADTEPEMALPFTPVKGMQIYVQGTSGDGLGINGQLVKVLPYNPLTSRYVLQPIIFISYKPPFYDIDDTVAIQFTVDVPADRDRTVDVTITLKRDGIVLREKEYSELSVKPAGASYVCDFDDYSDDSSAIQWDHLVGIYSIKAVARIHLEPGDGEVIVLSGGPGRLSGQSSSESVIEIGG